MSEPIGQLLQEWRNARGLSLGSLALQAGIGNATLSRWESGKAAPRLIELESVLSRLEVSEQQRQAALLSLRAPRALVCLDATGDRPPVGGDLLRAMRLRRRLT